MGFWSAENATEAYLKTMKMGKSDNEPDVAEFISAIAAGNNAQLMVVACGGATAGSITVGLAAAANQTGGRVICILAETEQLTTSDQSLISGENRVEFIAGDAQSLLSSNYTDADLVVVDCNLDNHEGILESIQKNQESEKGRIVLGCNAFSKDSWRWSGSESHLLPIGDGLLLMRIGRKNVNGGGGSGGQRRRSHWVVKVDKCTGEEHVFRVKLPGGRMVNA